MMKYLWGTSIFSLAVTFVVSPVHAQSSDAADPGATAPVIAAPARTPTPPAAEKDQADGVGDIVVIAEKRSMSINKIGLSMTAIGGEALRKQGISNVRDLSKVVPGLTYTESPSSTPVYTLRGVGFYETSLSAYPDVSVYVDQVPLPFAALTPQAGLDLERVEILKGPQGILFGENATGGLINYIAARPGAEPEAGFDLSYGRFNRAEFNGYVSGPVTDTLGARAAVRVERGDDWQRRYTGPGTSGKMRNVVGRLLTVWKPTDRLNVELNLNGWINNSDPQAPQYKAFNPQNPTAVIANARIAAVPFAPDDSRAANWSFPLRGHNTMYQAALTANYRLGDDVTLTSISTYSKYKKDDVDTSDGLPFPDETAEAHDGRISSFYQELRLANGSANRFRWTLGGNYQASKVYEVQTFNYSEGSLAEVFGVIRNDFFSSQRKGNYAAFVNGEFDIIPKLSIKAGVRYTRSYNDFTGCGYDSGDGRFSALFSGIATALTGRPVTIAPGQCFVLDKNTFLPGLAHSKLREDNVPWRVGLDYRASPNLLIYLNVTKGYKAGGFPTLGASTTRQYAPVVQESVLDYEGGFKAQLFDRTASLTGAVFYYDYSNKQVRGKLSDPIFGILDALTNVPASHVLGAELNLSARPVSGLDLSASVTYLDAVVDRYVGVNSVGLAMDFSGTPLPFSSRWQAAATADYRFAVGSSLFASMGTTISYHSQATAAVGGGGVSVIGKYALVDLRASIGPSDDRWRFAVWGRNVTDKYYWTNVVQVYDTTVRYAGQPATYGLTISVKY